MVNRFGKRFPLYPDDSDYNTNAPSYYDDLARKSKLIELLAKRIWEYENTLNETLEQIEKRLTDYITENDSLMNERLENWDQRIEEMPEEMRSLFVTWLNDGTLEQIINHDVLGNKADQSELDKTNRQLAHTWHNIHSYPKLEGETTDTERLKRMITDLKDGDTVYLPNIDTPYLLNDTVVIDKNIHFRVEGRLKYVGDKDKTVLHFIRPVNTLIDINRIESENTIDWGNSDYVGVLVTNGYMSNINIERVFGFDVGFKAQAQAGLADGGFWFNKIRIKRIDNCRVGQELNSDGDGAWLNANEFYETAVSYNSGIPKTTIADRYNILQTLTNGNEYGGNNNYFYNYKLETHGGFTGTHTMVKLSKAIDWIFRDFRREVTNAGSNEREFVMDMSYNRADIVTKLAHSTNNLIDGVYRFKIEFDNVGQLKDSFNGIIRNERDTLNTIVTLNGLPDKAKRVNDNNSILSNHVSSSHTNQSLNSESTVFYRVGGIKANNRMQLVADSALTFYITNVSKGDTFRIERPLNVFVQAYDSEETIVGNVRNKVAGFVSVNNNTNSLLQNTGNSMEFTVVDNTIKTLKIKLHGLINDVLILTDSKTGVFRNNWNDDLFTNGGYYSNVKPVYSRSYGFVVGDVIMNTKTTLPTPDAWQLQYNGGQYSWVDIV